MIETGRAATCLFASCALISFLCPSTLVGQELGDRLPSSSASTARGGSSIESSDNVLASALLMLMAARTPAHLDAVAVRYHQIGILDKAMDYYAESLRRNPSGVAALDGTARIWRDWGLMGAALGSAYRAVHAAPLSPEAWNTLGTILQDLRQYPAAANAYRRAATLDRSAVYVRSNLCYLAFVQGQLDQARSDCAAAVEMDGDFVPARNNLALVHAAAGNLDLADETFVAGAGEAAAHYNKGIVLMAQRKFAEAAQAFEAASRKEPTFHAARTRAADARRRVRAIGENKDAGR